MERSNKLVKVLFVCMGNICRSPSAEAVMNAYIEKAGLSDKIKCDSAGTIAYHVGEPADKRMQKHAILRNYRLTSISRQITYEDFENFDYIVAMDQENISSLQPLLHTKEYENKLSLMTDYCSNQNPGYVPDPYYGGEAGFEMVLDLMEDACNGLLNHIKNEHKLNHQIES